VELYDFEVLCGEHLTGPWQPIQQWQKDNAESLRSGSALPESSLSGSFGSGKK
jgi:hypothetical protein